MSQKQILSGVIDPEQLREVTDAYRIASEALAFAIDRQAIVTHLRRGLAELATGLLPPLSWAYAPDSFSFPFDPDRARDAHCGECVVDVVQPGQRQSQPVLLRA